MKYYTRMKMRIKEKKAKGGRIEEKIENCIKLGILSIIKSKKKILKKMVLMMIRVKI